MKNIRGWGSSNPRSFQGEGFAPYSTQIQFEFSKKATKNMKKSPSCSKSYFLKTKCFEIFVAFIGNLKYKGGRGISHGPTSSNKRWKRERETQVRREEYALNHFFFLLYSRQKYRRSSMLSWEHYTTGLDDFWSCIKVFKHLLHRNYDNRSIKVHTFWEGHKILRNLHLTFDCIYCSEWV